MASNYRALVAQRSQQAVKRILNGNISNIPKFQNLVHHMKIEKRPQGILGIKIPVSILLPNLDGNSEHLSRFIEEFETDDHIDALIIPRVEKTDEHNSGVYFKFQENRFMCKTVCEAIYTEIENIKLGNCNNLFIDDFDSSQNGSFKKEKIVIDFSSPNVAKPFHMGHLRSTIVGNFVANIYEDVGHEVVRLNYLGDWGTQFGYLAAGLKRHEIENVEDLSSQDNKSSVIGRLHEIYVDANKVAATDESFDESAKALFAKLEKGDHNLKEQWQFIRDVTVNELEKTYRRLNVRIDVYHGESMYGNQHCLVTNELQSKGLLEKLDDGREVIQIKTEYLKDNKDSQTVIVTKSDGSSLYITRDIAAAIDRKKLFEFDKMFYVVEKAQTAHFSNLFNILKLMGYEWSEHLKHITFGRIQGMSSRKGNAVFLSDILDEGQSKMIKQQSQSSNTKVDQSDPDFFEIADFLAMSAVVCNDLKQRRGKDYKFDWEKVLCSKGDSGIKLQYTHARLTSLLIKMAFLNNNEELRDPYTNRLTESKFFETLIEQEAIDLIYHISIFDEIIKNAYDQLEPCMLVNYLFRLCNVTSKALKSLGVKNAPNEQTAYERLALFAAARGTLRKGIKLLGLKPLSKI